MKTPLVVSLAIGALLGAAAYTAAASDNEYYLFNGRELTRVTRGRPEEVSAKEWQFWLYRKGAAASGSDYWGAITGRTVAAVRAELKSSQDFERTYERWCECSWGPETNFNALGPIAMVDAPLYPKSSELYDALDRLKKLAGISSQILEAAGAVDRNRRANPFRLVGAIFREYVDNLKQAYGRARQLRRMLNQNFDSAVGPLVAQLDDLLRRGEDAAPRVQHAIDEAYAAKPPAFSGPWTSAAYRAADGSAITQSMAFQNGVVAVTVTMGDAQQPLARRTFSFDPASVAADQLRVRPGGPTGWLVTITAPGRKITDESTSGGETMTDHVTTIDLAFRSESDAKSAIDAVVALARTRSSQQ
jgi:hypothetical protein